ncbi:hypothetical protein [Streptomyces sp. NBC_00878]|uniref:hypothetical protein n=1 Tax=Streptomyces sp. NBC_00878 TaxID=2975854 RepID=UPI002257BAD1|nr:hypothetical protein [Streptomyces sp. NBC_00878]MCX4905754.1 hypothetical protein [Streptomyces sp. NBC_00878]
MTQNISRRTALRRVAFVAIGVAVGSQALSIPAQAADKDPEPEKVREAIRRAQERNKRVLTGIPSKNGWEMEKTVDEHGHIYTRPVPATPLDGVQMRMAEVETVLVHVVRRFHYEIDTLRKGEVLGWREPGSVRKGLAESNLASGTAVRIRPGSYPSGAHGGFYPMEELVIRDILADCEGVVRWGGDDARPDESLFYIDVPPGDERLTRVAMKLRAWAYTPGKGAGVLIDPLQPQRRKAAERLAGQQS